MTRAESNDGTGDGTRDGRRKLVQMRLEMVEVMGLEM